MGRPNRKPKDDQYYENQIIDIYANPRDPEGSERLATVELIMRLSEADPQDCFMKGVDEKYNITRGLEKWIVRVLYATPYGESWNYREGDKKTVKLPIVFSVGAARVVSGVKTLRHAANQITHTVDYGFIDNFEGVPGWGQQF